MPTPSLSHVTGIVGGTLGVITNTLVMLVGGLFVVFDSNLYLNETARPFPVGHRKRARQVIGNVVGKLESWLLGQFIAMLAVGVLT